jgi:hypothetical protein
MKVVSYNKNPGPMVLQIRKLHCSKNEVYSKKNKGEILIYNFDKELCSNCPGRQQCAGALKSMQTQAKLTVLAINLKRIANLVSSALMHFSIKACFLQFKYKFQLNLV